jgi:hypothetical protein
VISDAILVSEVKQDVSFLSSHMQELKSMADKMELFENKMEVLLELHRKRQDQELLKKARKESAQLTVSKAVDEDRLHEQLEERSSLLDLQVRTVSNLSYIVY